MQQRDLRRRLQRVGVPLNAASIIAGKVARQIRSQGAENTARYLKSVGDCMLWSLYGTGAKPAWVHTRHNWPTFMWEVKGLDSQILVRVAKFARVIRLTAATQKQLDKVIGGVLKPFQGEWSSVREMTRLVSLGISRLGLKPSEPPSSEPILLGRQFSRVMSVSGPVENTSSPPILESFGVLAAWPELTNLPSWQRVFYPLRPESCNAILGKVEPKPRLLGEIHAAQEGGAKLRMYASPYTAVQCVLSPVHDWFSDYLRLLPMNCTWDQLRGALKAQAKLREGFVFSLDLSTATCRFPLDVQIEMARMLGLPDAWLGAIHAVSRGSWKVGRELDRRSRFISWVVGQPLGVRFSMSMFSLTHNLLLAGIASDLGFNPWESFNVLGDDVVIYHRPIAEVYAQLVQSAGIPISWNKSHQSDKVAEFAGAFITRDWAIRPGQFREATVRNVLELCEQFGVLEHETSVLSQKVQKLHLFALGRYNPPSVDEYSTLLRANSMMQFGFADLPRWKTRAPKWAYRIEEEITSQLSHLGCKLKFHWDADKPASGVFRELYSSPNLEMAKVFLKDHSQFQDPFEAALYWAWLGLYQDLCSGSITVEDFQGWVQRVLDYLHSLLYLPPRSRAGATKFKRLVAYLLPKGEGMAEAA